MLMLLLLGIMDITMLAIDWTSYNRATYAGARIAAISAPVAIGVNAPIAGTKPGQPCINPTTGAPTGFCTARSATTCIATGAVSGGSCTNGYTFSDAALNTIHSEMTRLLLMNGLDRRQISVTYTPTNVGFVSRSDGPPLNITVSTRCLRSAFSFLGGLMGWILPSSPSDCNGIGLGRGISLPEFRTTLPSEDLTTN